MIETSDYLAKEIRKHVVKMVYEAKASHIGGALSMVDLLAVLYTGILNINPSSPQEPSRDRLLISKGHACTSLYAALALRGFFPVEELQSYSQNGSRLLSHTSHKVPGVEVSSGSLGHSLPIACGLALAAKTKKVPFFTYCLVSDGELDEGSNWEAILFAPHHQLDNLVLIVDYNKIQSLGKTNEVLGLEPLDDKFKSFGWNVIEINGHDHNEIKNAFLSSKEQRGKPSVIIAHTIKGKGISFMENELLWHYKSPSVDEYNEALKQVLA